MREFVNTGSIIAILFSAAAILAGALLEVNQRRRRRQNEAGSANRLERWHQLTSERQDTDDDPDPATRRLAELRTEAQLLLEKYERTSKRSRFSAVLLTFAQYVVGGTLATSFVQDSLTPDLVGVLGVLVLASTLIHQSFRPDTRHRLFQRSALQLKELLRATLDGASELRSGHAEAKSAREIIRALSKGLSRIERNHFAGSRGRGDW